MYLDCEPVKNGFMETIPQVRISHQAGNVEVTDAVVVLTIFDRNKEAGFSS